MKKRVLLYETIVLLFISICFLLFDSINSYAIDFVPIKTDGQWVDGIIEKNEIDYYKVTTTDPGYLTVTVQGFSVKKIIVDIYNSDLTRYYTWMKVSPSSAENPCTDSMRLALEPGTYVIKLDARGNTGDYRIKTSFLGVESTEIANNDSLANAQPVVTNKKNSGFMSYDDRKDFYKFKINKPKTIRLKLWTDSRSVDIKIYDYDYISVYSNNVDGGYSESPYIKDLSLSAGTYYFFIEPRYGYSDFHGWYDFILQEDIKVSKLSIQGNHEMTASKTQLLNINISPDRATNKTIQWYSSNTKIASVSSNGKVTAKRAGKVTITAYSTDGGNKASKFTIIVKPKRINSLNGKKLSRTKGHFSWKRQKGVSGYQIQYSYYKNFKNAKIKSVSNKKTTVDITGLSSKKCYVRIRAYYSCNGKKYYGKWSKVKIV